MSLSPWDLSGHIRLDVDQFRPRRASYVFATQLAGGGSLKRARRESYRTATRTSDSSDGESLQRGESRLKRKESYRNATLAAERAEAREAAAATSGSATIDGNSGSQGIADNSKLPGNSLPPHSLPQNGNGNGNGISNGNCQSGNHYSSQPNHSMTGTYVTNDGTKKSDINMTLTIPGDHGVAKAVDSVPDGVFLDDDWAGSADVEHTLSRYRKDVAVLATGFVLVFSSFRAIQNVESSLNSGPYRLGVICMATVYGLTFLFCHLSPAIIGRLSAKRAMVVGLVTYMLWTAANCYPRFYTLLPASLCLGIGQSLTWDAMIVYARRRVSDYAAAMTFFYQPALGGAAAQNAAMLTDSGTERGESRAAAAPSVMTSSEATRATDNSSSSQLSSRTAREMSRFHNIFLASFQTSHIWGNLVSSLMLDGRIVSWSAFSSSSSSAAAPGDSIQTVTTPCGAYELYRFMPGVNATAGATGESISLVNSHTTLFLLNSQHNACV